MAEQGSFNYIVKAVVGVTIASVIMPHFLSKAVRQGRLIRAAMLGIGFALSIAVIFTAAIHRTGGAQDAAEAARKQAARKIEIAKANVKSAEDALASDERLVAGECKTGVGKECKRLSAEGKDTLQETIALRKQYADTPETIEDGTAHRISAITGLSEQQLRMYTPFLVPIAMSFLAGILVTIGLETDAPAHRTPKQDRDGESIEVELKPADPEPAETVVELPLRVPDRPKPMLAATTGQPVGAVLDFLHGGTEIIAGARTEMTDAFIGYAAWCKARPLRSLDVKRFVDEMAALCKRFGIRIIAEDDSNYLINVRLLTASENAMGE